MQSYSRQSYVVPDIKTLIAEETRKFWGSPFKTGALVLIVMLIMFVSALSLGAWWDGLSNGSQF